MAADDEPPLPDSLERAVERAAGLAPAQRDAALAALGAEHPEHVPAIRILAALRGLDAAPSSPPLPETPQCIGPYRLERLLGQGGMGTVWLASQEQPVRRRVAIKLIKPAMDSGQIVKRFEAERQALALMEHSSIARVFDGGLTDDGRPYFVMEYVDGESITAFCKLTDAGIDTRLELIEQVCAGVAHAHQKGVIHRDLKPSNVLVTRENGVPRAKIIDFGLARAVEGEQLANTMLTLQGQVLGTPAYMSPEQATFDSDRIDTRTDVYALGVVMYELITGELPLQFDGGKLDLATIQRRICDEDPVRPSSRVSSRAGSAKPRPLWVRRLRGELDWIVMRALEKQPERRYGSATALATDIRRYLDDLPVEARPPSTFYQLTKFARRNRGLFAGAAIAVLALVLGTVTSTVFAWQAVADRNAAETARKAAVRAREESESVARFQSRALNAMDVHEIGQLIAKQLGTDLRASGLFGRGEAADTEVKRVLAAINPTNLAREALDQSLLRTAVDAIDQQFADQPLVAARLHASFAQAYTNLGLVQEALARCRRAYELRRQQLGENHHDTVTALGDLGFALTQAGKLEEARPVLEKAYAARSAADPPDPKLVAEAAYRLAMLFVKTGQLDEAERRAREAATTWGRIGDKGHRVWANNVLANVLRHRRRTDEAISVLESSLSDAREIFGSLDDTTLGFVNNIGMLLLQSGRAKEAVERFREVLPPTAQLFGDDDLRTLQVMRNLGRALADAGDRAGARKQLEEALHRAQRSLPPDHPYIARFRAALQKLAAK